MFYEDLTGPSRSRGSQPFGKGFRMAATKPRRPRGTLQERRADLLRRGGKLVRDSRQLITEAKRLLDISAKLVASSQRRKKTPVS